MESLEVRLARVEEGVVAVKGNTSIILKKIDLLVENHWKLSGKVIGLAGTLSLVTTILTTVALRLVMK